VDITNLYHLSRHQVTTTAPITKYKNTSFTQTLTQEQIMYMHHNYAQKMAIQPNTNTLLESLLQDTDQ
jgi:hypothetical protein